MKHVEQNGEWSLFCLNEAPNIHEVHGVEFEELYTRYELIAEPLMETIENSVPDETAMCNLASLAIPSFTDNG